MRTRYHSLPPKVVRVALGLMLLVLLQASSEAGMPAAAAPGFDNEPGLAWTSPEHTPPGQRFQSDDRQGVSLTSSGPDVRYAVNAHPLQPLYDHASPFQVVDLALSLGIRLIRIDIHWAWIEVFGPGQDDWNPEQIARLEAFLEAARQHNIEIMAVVTESPCWASSDPEADCSPQQIRYDWRYPPRNAEDFAAFVGGLVERYHDQIRYWEIWGEPNLPHLWYNPDATKYAELLIAAYDAIKQKDPTAAVIGGCLGPWDGDGSTPDALTYLDEMYAAGARGHFDALSFHPYTDGHSPDWYDARWPLHSFVSSVPAIRQRMLDHGDDSPIWLTEFGWTTVTECIDCWTPSLPVSEEEQASYLSRALSLVYSWPYVAGVVWYELVDRRDAQGHSFEDHFGLYRYDLTPKPAVAAYRAFTCYDFDGDGQADVDDLQVVVTRWRQAAEPPYDSDGDGRITIMDIMRVAAAWGACI